MISRCRRLKRDRYLSECVIMNIEKLISKIETSADEISKDEEPGFCCGIVKNGSLVFSLSHGLANMESVAPLTNSSLFYLASDSKQFTAACILNLVNDGLISLDDDVRDIVDETRHFDQKISVQNLLNHTSGIPEYLDRISCDHDSNYFDNKDSLKLVSKFDSLEFTPNEKFEYSNSNYILLMAAVQTITGQTPAHYAQEKVFAPVGMNSTLFDDDRLKVIKNRVYSYTPDKINRGEYRVELKNSCTVGDGGVLSGINDLMLWEANIHENKCLPDTVISGLFNTTELNSGEPNYYANGTEISPPENKYKYSFHGGAFEGFRSMILRIHDEKLSVIYLSNNPTAPISKLSDKWPLDFLYLG